MTRTLYERLRAEVLAVKRLRRLALHSATHEAGNSDAIDITTLGGFPGGSTLFLREDGVFALPPGATPGLVWIEEQTPSATGTLTFSSLGAYTHLEIRWSARSDRASVTQEDMAIRFNADSSAIYDRELLFNSSDSGAAASAAFAGTSGLIGSMTAATAPAGRAGAGVIRVMDYRGTTFNKVATAENHVATGTTAGTLQTRTWGVTWRNAAAVTSITLFLGTGNYVAGSKFTLYGLI